MILSTQYYTPDKASELRYRNVVVSVADTNTPFFFRVALSRLVVRTNPGTVQSLFRPHDVQAQHLVCTVLTPTASVAVGSRVLTLLKNVELFRKKLFFVTLLASLIRQTQ